ncbi:MAG: beta-mannosidase [Ignavibacteriae bacterium]|nr:beta-mannosidase [Ignavibacteriota bacterium]
MKLYLILLVVLIFSSCTYRNESKLVQEKLGVKLIDSNATFGTIALFYHLQKNHKSQIIFGHQHSTAYGIGWRDEINRSDVKDVTGNYPGLIGWDFADLNYQKNENPDWLKNHVIASHDNGLINIFAWHLNNLVTGGSFYDTTIVVKHILPGGSHHENYKSELDRISYFLKHLIGKDGKLIPIIFRPFHEFDGSWFWWGDHFCTPEEFIELWQFTVKYLRDIQKVKNVIYAFSPDRNFYNEVDFLEKYPGDEFVDLIGMDNYWDFSPAGEGLNAAVERLKLISKIAKDKNKIAALTETGLEKIPDEKWWTEKLLKVIKSDSVNISFVMVWRNAHINHFYAPYKNHPSAQNFIEFKNDPKIIFADELPDLFNIDMILSK